MNNQNIISNKFNLNWSTSFSYTRVQWFFWNPTPFTTFQEKGGICTNAQHIQTTKAMTLKMTQENDDAQNKARKWRSQLNQHLKANPQKWR